MKKPNGGFVIGLVVRSFSRFFAFSVVAMAAQLNLPVVQGADPAGKVNLQGSSTVAPIASAAAELFMKENATVRVTVGISGTGGGFKKFLDEQPELRPDICNASRPIDTTELERAKKLGIEFVEIPIAMDGMAIVVHPTNSFCDHLTLAELKRIWEPGSTINNWKDIRPGFPNVPLKLYGAGTDSGTFDYFTQVVVGKEKSSRSDYTASENDNTLVQGVTGDAGSLGYFGYAYYEANKNKLKLLAVDSGDGKPVRPSPETIHSGSYHPLARPLFMYVSTASLGRREVEEFLNYVLSHAKGVVEHPRVGYVALAEEHYNAAKKRVKAKKTGTVFGQSGGTGLDELFKRYSAD
ncbi:MAG: PstS family phosphate ABC transporter substrate-binding protein [Planctomycetota bacterium]